MTERKFFTFEKGGRVDLPHGWTVIGIAICAADGRDIAIIEAERDVAAERPDTFISPASP
jgi:hypothetical protein